MQLLANDPTKKVFTISTTFKRSLWLKLPLGMNTSGHGSVSPPKVCGAREGSIAIQNC